MCKPKKKLIPWVDPIPAKIRIQATPSPTPLAVVPVPEPDPGKTGFVTPLTATSQPLFTQCGNLVHNFVSCREISFANDVSHEIHAVVAFNAEFGQLNIG